MCDVMNRQASVSRMVKKLLMIFRKIATIQFKFI